MGFGDQRLACGQFRPREDRQAALYPFEIECAAMGTYPAIPSTPEPLIKLRGKEPRDLGFYSEAVALYVQPVIDKRQVPAPALLHRK